MRVESPAEGAMFESFDDNGDGRISVDELEAGLQRLNLIIPKSGVEKLVRRMVERSGENASDVSSVDEFQFKALLRSGPPCKQ